MPVYIKSNTNCGISGDNNYCRDTSKFFSELSTKLLDMAMAINDRIEKIKSQVCSTERGVIIAAIDTPNMMLGVRYEYVEYIKRYGPPQEGKFDENLLQSLRVELGLTGETAL